MNLAALASGHHPEGRAVWDGQRFTTWGELRRRAAAAAFGLRELGVAPGDRVALVWPSGVDFVVAYLAVLGVGAVAVPLNPASPSAELERELAAVDPVGVLADPAGADAVGLLKAASVGVRFVVLGRGSTVPSWEDLSAPAKLHFEPVERGRHDPAVLLFTSGTAGEAKPAVLTHGNLLANLRQMGSVPGERIEPRDIGFTSIPLFHVFGLNVVLGVALATGLPLVLEERFCPQASLQLVRDLAVTLVVGAPPTFQGWLALPEADAPARSFAGVRRAVSGAAALAPEVAMDFEARFGVPLAQGYGLTEAGPVVSTTVGTGRNRPGSVGRPLPGVQVRLVDTSGGDALQGDPGEIWVHGDNVFPGYWQDPQATAEVLAGGWLRTGDVAVVSDDGDLFLVDRTKDLIIVSGFNVYPAEVERCLAEHPDVAEAAVRGVPDPTTGEAVEAVVVARSGRRPDGTALVEHCRARLAHYKCPSRIRFTDRLPRNVAGKALRRALDDRAW